MRNERDAKVNLQVSYDILESCSSEAGTSNFFLGCWYKKNQDDTSSNDSGEVNVDTWFNQYLPVDTWSGSDAVGAATVWSLIGNNTIGHGGKNGCGEKN
jgi:hypothetical protein